MNHRELRLLCFVFSVLAGAGADASPDCIFPSSTLAVDYAKADAIVVAQVNGCVGFSVPGNGRCPDELYRVDVVQVLKDSIPSRDHGGVIKGRENTICRAALRAGYRYLLFLDENGAPDLSSSGNLSRDDTFGIATQERLQRLKQFRDGIIEDLSEPWRFEDFGTGCHISHSFHVRDSYNGGNLTFAYKYSEGDYRGSERLVSSRGPNSEYRLDSGPDVPKEEALHAKLTGLPLDRNAIDFSASLGDFHAVEGSASITIGDRTWPLHRRSIFVQIGRMASDPAAVIVEAISGEAANEIFEDMRQPIDVVISAVAVGIGPEVVSESPVRFETRTTQFPDAAKKFKACVDGTGRQANPELH